MAKAIVRPEEFTTGDVAYLRSGGPAMTVLQVGESCVQCRWFTSAGMVLNADFPIVALTLTKPKD